MRQRTLGILGGALLVVGTALAVVTGIVAHSTANRNAALPTTASIGNQRSEPVRPPLHRGQRPGPFFGRPGGPDLPGVRGPNSPNN